MFGQLTQWLWDPAGLTPHGFCLLWEPGVIWTYATADVLIGCAYLAISLALVTVARRRKGLLFLPLFWMFAAFIEACGVSHWVDALTLWVPAYGLEGIVKVVTALLSTVTAIVLWQNLPILLGMPSPQEYSNTGEALRRSESFLERTGRAARVGGWELDIATGELLWTKETYRIFGVDTDYKPSVEASFGFYTPDAQRTLRAALAHATVGGHGYDLELGFVQADGTRLWVRTYGTVVLEDGQPARVTGAIQDVTEQVRQRVALEAANQRSLLATEAAGIGIWEWDASTDKVVWDDCMYGLYGIPRCDTVDYATWVGSLHPEDRARAEAALQNGLAGRAPFDTEFRIVQPNGCVRHIRAIARAVHDGQGSTRRMIGVSWDLTEARELAADRDRQAVELAQSEERFRLIAENASDVISLVGLDGIRTYASPATKQVFGLTPDEFKASTAETYIHPGDRDAVAATQAALLSGQMDEGNVVFRALNPERDNVWIEVNARALSDPRTGERAGYVSVSRDVSDRLQVEAELRAKNSELDRMARHFARAKNLAERANGAKTRFLAAISHELRTPLNGILGYAQLLRMEGGLTQTQLERVDVMLGAGKHLLEMISGVLDLTEIESETLELQMGPVDLRAVIEACIGMVRPTAEAKGLAIKAFVMDSVPNQTTTDPKRLRQILLNLVGNAVKYTRRGAVKLQVTTSTDDQRIRIEVSDTGPGIPPEQQALLFNDYERLHEGSVSHEEGSGLGLSLAKKLTKLLNGSIGYEDNRGGGSVFWFEIPHAIPAPQPAFQGSAGATAAPVFGAGASLRVLVADDVAMNRDVASAFLKSAECDVVCVAGGAEAIAAVASEDFDVVLMDVRMPDIDGLEATRAIRTLDGPRANVPIVALTAQAFTEQVEACRQAGMDCHLTKPFTMETLLSAIKRGIAMRQSLQAPPVPENFDAPCRTTTASGHIPLDVDLPVIAEETLKQTAALLTPDALARHFAILVQRSEALRARLVLQDRSDALDKSLIEDAHSLAGSAGMFGFDRLVFFARVFERSARTGSADQTSTASDLIDAIDATLPEMQGRALRLDSDAAEPAYG